MPPTFHPDELGSDEGPVGGNLRGTALTHIRLIRVSGADRATFLQGQLTQDMRVVDQERSALYGWTTAQGRLLVTGQIFTWRDAFWLTVPADSADDIARRLRMFVLRSRASIEVATVNLFGLWGPSAAGPIGLDSVKLPPVALACADTGTICALRAAGDATRIIVALDPDQQPPAAQPGSVAEWSLADIRAGIPLIGLRNMESFVPQMVNLDLVGGVAFDKGCYSGQEIITRTRHLGRIKRRMLRFGCSSDVALGPGDSIFAAGREAGGIVDAAAAGDRLELLAVVPLESLATGLMADLDGRYPLQRLNLPYRVPEVDLLN